MGKKPGSGSRPAWFFYKTRRKIRFLRHRGTLFHYVPRKERLSRKRTEQLKQQRQLRRKLRHFFYYMKPAVVKRFNSIRQAEISAFNERSLRHRVLAQEPVQSHPPLSGTGKHHSMRDRIRRPARRFRFVLRQARKKRAFRRSLKKPNPSYRKIRYLYHTGQLLNFRFTPLLSAFRKKFSFLGKKSYLIILVNSTVIFLLAYLVVFLIKELSIVLVAESFRIKSVMMYYDVEYLIRSRDWTPDAVKVVFSTGPVVTAVLTIVSLTAFSFALHERLMIRIFIMWVFLHALTQCLGDMIFGTLLNQGFGWVLTYIYYTDTDKMLVVAAIFLTMLISGLSLSRLILFPGNIYFNNLTTGNRMPFVLSQVLLPYLLGTGLIFLLKQPMVSSFDLVVESSMLFMILPGIIRTRFASDLFFDEEPRKIRLHWIWILAGIISLLIFRGYFWSGVRF
jgi:hypothetical protein